MGIYSFSGIKTSQNTTSHCLSSTSLRYLPLRKFTEPSSNCDLAHRAATEVGVAKPDRGLRKGHDHYPAERGAEQEAAWSNPHSQPLPAIWGFPKSWCYPDGWFIS